MERALLAGRILNHWAPRVILPGMMLLGLIVTSGCRVSPPQVRRPGTVGQQQYRASLFDPYTDVNIAPEVVGGRPREFQTPMPNPDRNKWVWNQASLGEL